MAAGTIAKGRVAGGKGLFGLERTRRITPEAGRALQILGHAIEYLADEYMRERRVPTVDDPQIAAIQLLMALNRQVYYECPVVTTLLDRIHTLLLPWWILPVVIGYCVNFFAISVVLGFHVSDLTCLVP